MTIAARCAHCRANLRLPDSLDGKKAKCPKCAKVFQVTAAEVDETVASRPKPSRPKRRRPKKKASNQGLIVGLSVGAGVLVVSLIVIGIVIAKNRVAELPPAQVVAQAVPAPQMTAPATPKVEPPGPKPAPPQPQAAPVAEIENSATATVVDDPAYNEPEVPRTAPGTRPSPSGAKLAPGTRITVRAQLQGSPPKFQGDFNKHITQRIEIALRNLGYEPVPDGGLILQVNAQVGPTGASIKVRTIGPSPPPPPRPIRPVKGQPPPQPPSPPPPREQTYPTELVTASLVLTDMRGSAIWKHDHQFRSTLGVFRTTDPPSEMREQIWRDFESWAGGAAVATMR